MAAKLNFTKKAIEAIKPPAKGRDTYSDTVQTGLKLRVTSNGVKTFTLIKKVHGKTHFLALGQFPAMSVSEARTEAGDQAARLAKGEDPRNPKPDKLTFEDLFNKYMLGHAKPHKKTWQEDQKNFDRYLTTFRKKAVADIDRAKVSRLHTKLGDKNGHYTANRVLALLKVVFNYGRNTLGLAIDNPAKGVKMFREESRERFLDGEELKAFFDALNDTKETPQQWRDFFSLALFTGARRANLQGMRWQHIDLNNALWSIPGEEFKNGQAFKCVLSKPALEILMRRKLEATAKARYVFPAHSKSGHVEEPKKAWKDILKRAKLEDVRLHDLRRTLGSWQAATGASLQVIGKTLGHRNQATTAIYSRLNLDPVKSALDTATAAMMQAMNGDEK